jgi:hypothetical protein
MVFDVSMNIKDLQNCYVMHHLPAVEVKEKTEDIDDNNYIVKEEGDSIVTYQKHGNNVAYDVDCSSSTCTCRCFMKMAYCKHMLHAHALLNGNSENMVVSFNNFFIHYSHYQTVVREGKPKMARKRFRKPIRATITKMFTETNKKPFTKTGKTYDIHLRNPSKEG